MKNRLTDDDQDTLFTTLLLIHGRAPVCPMPTAPAEVHQLYGQRFRRWSAGVKRSMRVYGYPMGGSVWEFCQWYEENTDEQTD